MVRIENIAFDATYYPVAVVSCVFFLWIFKYVSPSLSAYLCPSFSQISWKNQIGWHSRVSSSCHASIVSIVCVYILLLDEELSRDPVWHDSVLVRANCAVVVGFMMSDLILMMMYLKEIGEIGYLLHHVASLYAYYYVMTYGVLQYFANYRLMAEFSTVFVNKRWFFSSIGYKITDRRVFINGWMMAAVFFGCRVVSMPWYWYKLYSVYGTPDYLRLGNIQYVLIGTCVLLDVLNLAWFFKMCKGIHRILTSLQLDANRNITDEKKDQ